MLFSLAIQSQNATRRFPANPRMYPRPANWSVDTTKGAPVPNSKMDGFDISSWQDGLQLSKLKWDFAIFKATEGNRFVDSCFSGWASYAKKNNRLFGFYHFVNSPSVGGSFTAQAEYFYKHAKEYFGHGIPFLDWEDASYSSVLSYGPKGAKEFLDHLYKLSGIRAMIYTSQSVTNEYDWSSVAKTYKLWMAEYANMDPQYGYEENPWRQAPGYWKDPPTIHQYSGTGILSGYSDELDLDKAYISSSEWKKIASGK